MSTAGGLRIAILDDYQKVALRMADWSRLNATAVDAFHDHMSGTDELVARLAPYDVVVVMRERTPFPAQVFESLPLLRLLVTTGPANAVVDLAAAERAGVTVCGTRYSPYDTAELTWGLILALARNLVQEHSSVQRGGWQVGLGRGLAGKRLGVVGLGNLGSRVARIGTAFGMHVVAWSPNLTDDRARAHGAVRVAKEELFATSDVVTIHMKLVESTRHLIGEQDLQRMRRDAFLINTSRGALVDERALVAALESGRIAGAGLDVFSEEPLPVDHPFRRLPNVVVTPHIGYVTEDCYRIFYHDAVENIEAFQRGTPIRLVGTRWSPTVDIDHHVATARIEPR